MSSNAPDVRVENQLFRFTHQTPVSQDDVVSKLKGRKSGTFVLVQLKSPKATILIDADGRIVVHGTKRIELARSAAKEVLLQLNRDDSGLSTELGPIMASFDYSKDIDFTGLENALAPMEVESDEQLGCMRINDERHELELLLWPNGKAVALGAQHPNLVAMSAVVLREKIISAGKLVG